MRAVEVVEHSANLSQRGEDVALLDIREGEGLVPFPDQY